MTSTPPPSSRRSPQGSGVPALAHRGLPHARHGDGALRAGTPLGASAWPGAGVLRAGHWHRVEPPARGRHRSPAHPPRGPRLCGSGVQDVPALAPRHARARGLLGEPSPRRRAHEQAAPARARARGGPGGAGHRLYERPGRDPRLPARARRADCLQALQDDRVARRHEVLHDLYEPAHRGAAHRG